MSEAIVQLNEAAIKGELKTLVKNSVEETLNALLEHEADELVKADRYERSNQRQGYRSGHYKRNFTTTSGDVTLMSKSRQIAGDPEQVSPLFSGKDATGNPLKNHQHAFYWPCDLDGDGKIDHVKVVAPRAITPGERVAFENLKKIWSGGRDLGKMILLHAQPLAQREEALVVENATPVVFGRHYKPHAGSFDEWLVAEVRRSCVEVGLPEPVTVEPAPVLPCRDGAPIRWSEFVCQRKGERPTHGYGFRLTFSQPVKVPFAIGKMAHFGLGLFMAKK